jgi:hypothetical protein
MPSQATQKAPKSDDQVDLLQEYANWSSPNYSYAELLQECSEYPSKSIWLQACHQAVKDENQGWLENPPLDLLYPRLADADRKNTAQFISNCALKALLIKQAIKSNNASKIDFQDIEKLEDAHTSDESTKDLIQYFASETRPSEDEKVTIKVLLAGNEGKLGQLEIEKIPNGAGKIFPDPAFMAFSRYETDFEESIKTAFKYVADTDQIEEAQNYNYRWRLFDRSNTKKEDNNFRVLDKPLRGSSMGFAAALAFLQLFKAINISLAKYAFTGKIDEHGVLKSVGEYPDKLQAGKNFTLYFPDADREAIKHYREDGYLIEGTVTVKDAIADIKQRNRVKRAKNFFGFVAVIIGMLLLATVVYAWRGSSLKAENERQQKELFSRQLEIEKQQGEVKDRQLELEKQQKDVAQRDTEAERQKRLNEENNRKNAEKEKQLAEERETLAKQQSKILAQKNQQLDEKNIQLDKAKQIAENNEKEAKFQTGIAEKNEKLAQASQQVAYASQLASEGYKRLAEGDKNSAQTFFAKALSLNDREEYRSGLLTASFGEFINTKLSWSKVVGDDIENSNIGSFASLNVSGEVLAVSYNNGQNVRIVNTLDGSEISNLSFQQSVTAVALSPNIKYLAIRTADSKLKILELETKRTYFETDVQDNEHLNAITFNSDGKYLATTYSNNSVLVLDMETRQIINKFSHTNDLPNAEIFSLAFSSNDYLAYGLTTFPYKVFGDSPIFIRSIKDNSDVKKINSSGLNINLGFTKSDLITSTPLLNAIASISSDSSSSLTFSGGITIFTDIEDNLMEQEQPDKFSLKQKMRPDYLFAVSRNSDYFVSTGDQGYIRFWEGEKQLQQISFPMGKPVKILMGENGRVLFLNSKGKIHCWETDINSYYERKNKGFENWSSFEPSKTIEIFDNEIVVRDFKTDKIVLSFKRGKSVEDDPIIAVSPDGNKIAVLSERRILEVYNANNRNKLFHYTFDNKIDVCCLKFSNDGQQLAVTRSTISYITIKRDEQIQSIEQSNSVDIFNFSNSKIQSKITLPINLSKNFRLVESSFSPKGTFYVVRSDDSIYFFDSLTGQLKQSIPFQQTECDFPTGCSWFAISSDEKYVGITYLGNQTVQLWNIDNYRYLVDVIKTGVSSPEFPVGVGFTKNSQLLVWGSGSSGRLHFYDVRSNRKLADFPTNEMVFQITNAFDGNLIINYVNKLDEDNLNLLLFGSPNIINSAILNKNGFKINSQDFNFMSQEYINSILPERRDFEMVAITKNSVEEKGESEFGGAEVMKVKINANGTSTQCPIAFENPIFNPYPLTFKSPADFCANYPIIDVRKIQGGSYSPDKQTWLSTRLFNTGDDFYVLLYMSNGAANNLIGETAIAKNVKIKVKINLVGNDEYILSATLVGENLAPLTSAVRVKIPQGNHLVYPNKVEIYDNHGKPPPLNIIDVSNAEIREEKNLSFEVLIGNLEPGFATDLFARFQISVKQD